MAPEFDDKIKMFAAGVGVGCGMKPSVKVIGGRDNDNRHLHQVLKKAPAMDLRSLVL